MAHPLPYLSLGISLSIFTALKADDLTNNPKNGLSNLSVLPTGSLIKNIKVPRYDKNLTPTSLILADQIEVVSKKLITAKNLKLRRFDKTGADSFKMHLPTAEYLPEKELITSDSQLTFSIDRSSSEKGGVIYSKAHGMIVHWESQRGYLFGPTHTQYITPIKTTMKSVKSSIAPLIAGTLISTATATEPQPLSQEKINELEIAKTIPTAPIVSPQDEQKIAAIQASLESKKNEATAFLQEFAPEKVTLITTEGEENKQAPAIKKGEDENQIDIISEGGMFFDTEKGLLNFRKNIKVREPRFKLQCSKDLKVYLVQPAEPKKENKDPKKPKVKAKKDKGISRILAIGDVSIQGTQVDEKGVKRSIRTSSEIAEYDYIKGTVILKGGYPVIHSTENGRTLTFTAKEKNLWIKIEKDGSFRTSKGKWHQRITGLKEAK